MQEDRVIHPIHRIDPFSVGVLEFFTHYFLLFKFLLRALERFPLTTFCNVAYRDVHAIRYRAFPAQINVKAGLISAHE